MSTDEQKEVDGQEEPEGEDDQASESGLLAENMARRSFVRRSAEVAALSLFGVTALDAVLDKVVSRMGDIGWMEGVARSVGKHLRESGVIAVAEACVPNVQCPEAQNFACNANTTPVFTGCGGETYQYVCQWGENFYCTIGETAFDCDTEFSCPPWVGGIAWFDCADPDFTCDYPDPFSCGGSGAAYLCPGVNQFYELDCPQGHECIRGSEYSQRCSPPEDPWHCTESFKCANDEVTVKFTCGERPPGGGGFSCGGTGDAAFSCDSTTIYDFDCLWEFTCGLAAAQAFNCDSNHEFQCWTAADLAFICAYDFRCTAGGNHCGLPMTGGYSYPPPGDFFCDQAGPIGFACQQQTKFLCAAADDFKCGHYGTFQCTAPFTGCQPPAGGEGVFECNLEGRRKFVCVPNDGNEFSCAEGAPFSDVGG